MPCTFFPPSNLQYPYMANPYAGAYPYGAGYGGYAQPGAPAYPPQVRTAGALAGLHGASCARVCHPAL